MHNNPCLFPFKLYSCASGLYAGSLHMKETNYASCLWQSNWVGKKLTSTDHTLMLSK